MKGLNISIWKVMWKLRILNRIKVFSWRILNDILPTGENLLKRRCKVDGLCRVCGETETLLQALKDCSFTTAIWFGSPVPLQTSSMNPPFQAMAARSSRTSSVDEVIKHGIQLLTEFQEANLPHSSSVDPSIDRQDHSAVLCVNWSPPPSGWVKVDFDGALEKNGNRAGVGIVI